MLFVQTTPEEFKNVTAIAHYGFAFEENLFRKIMSFDYRGAIFFETLRFRNVFGPHENEGPTFPNFSGLKSIFVKLRFRDGVVWTVGLTVEIKLRFQIYPA